jgi:hypothetical protein
MLYAGVRGSLPAQTQRDRASAHIKGALDHYGQVTPR